MTSDERGWRETRHLLGNPRNAARLRESIRQADAGLRDAHPLPTSAQPQIGNTTANPTRPRGSGLGANAAPGQKRC
jgi:hypothetical protein